MNKLLRQRRLYQYLMKITLYARIYRVLCESSILDVYIYSSV